ncbi:cupin domain-containing protein [Brevibacterium sp. RIT803]|nr:cupin domain-containing protein [Brevibacterium sp. RIT 803]
MEPIGTHDLPLEHEPVEDWQRMETADSADGTSVAGTTTAFAELGTIAGAEYGLWEMSAGAMRDVEGEEVFLVISGTGRIEFDSPELSPVVLSPGRLVRLEAGMKTRWYVDEAPLRKLFISPRD